jgi:hypothetical protein
LEVYQMTRAALESRLSGPLTTVIAQNVVFDCVHLLSVMTSAVATGKTERSLACHYKLRRTLDQLEKEFGSSRKVWDVARARVDAAPRTTLGVAFDEFSKVISAQTEKEQPSQAPPATRSKTKRKPALG